MYLARSELSNHHPTGNRYQATVIYLLHRSDPIQLLHAATFRPSKVYGMLLLPCMYLETFLETEASYSTARYMEML
jgi:hypothetical protein